MPPKPPKRVSLKGKGADLFFGDYTPPVPHHEPPASAPADELPDATPTAMHPDLEAPTTVTGLETGPGTPDALMDSPAPVPALMEATQPVAPKTTARSTSKPRPAPLTPPSMSPQARRQASTLASLPSDEMIAAIRKIVRTPGKEVSFTRLTADEKGQLSDLIYERKKHGQKTTENEINRIAINYLLRDYREHGEASVLARVLAALQA